MGYASQSGRARTSSRNPQAHAICDLTSLYLVTNIMNNKTYVGVTRHKNLNRRMSEHAYAAGKNKLNGHFQRALRKHGRAAFKIELIKCFDSRESAFNAEIEYIALNKPTYNSTLGGDVNQNSFGFSILQAGSLFLAFLSTAWFVLTGGWIPQLLSMATNGWSGAIIIGNILRIFFVMGLVFALIRVVQRIRP